MEFQTFIIIIIFLVSPGYNHSRDILSSAVNWHWSPKLKCSSLSKAIPKKRVFICGFPAM